jgi:hypothetical protein
MTLRIERPTRQLGVGEESGERAALEAALRTLQEVQANVPGLALLPVPEDSPALRRRSQELARAAMTKAELSSESPLSPLHQEHSGWGLPVLKAPGVPWEILAADVFDFLASLLSSADRLVSTDEAG